MVQVHHQKEFQLEEQNNKGSQKRQEPVPNFQVGTEAAGSLGNLRLLVLEEQAQVVEVEVAAG